MFKIKFIFLLLTFVFSTVIYAQNNLMLKGYVKGMTAVQTIDKGNKSFENTLHNRFDFNWYINKKFTFTIGLRNRIITGNNRSLIPNYSNYLSRDNGYFDLSGTWANNNTLIGISQLDRIFIDYYAGKFQITLGRQRINWGQTFVWNPNDLFNTYSYFDFDYEEKPGSDALRIQYYVGESSKIELSTSINSNKKVTSAILYKFNTHGFDIQFMTGILTENDYIIGGGWSGSIGGGGFGGEYTYYHPINNSSKSKGNFTATIHYDYTFKNSLNLQFETLYNGFGVTKNLGGLERIIFMDLSPKNLFPTKIAVFGSVSYNLTPLFTVVLAGIYGSRNFLYVGPTFTYSLSDSSQLALIGQYFSMNNVDNVGVNKGSSLFIRYKYSF